MNWIPAISATTLLALALLLSRKLLITRLTKSVQHEFDAKLETLRSQLRQNAVSFTAELRQRDDAIAAARAASLSALASNRAVLDKRRIDAVDEILRAMRALSAGKWAAIKLSIYKMDYLSEQIEHEPKLVELFK